MSTETLNKVDAFVDSWDAENDGSKTAFLKFFEQLKDLEKVELTFNERPGVSYSLRGKHEAQEEPLFVMVDVIDDDPELRWLSVCFYGDMITDPDELGDFVPGGLLGKDGHCFDVDENDDSMVAYLVARIAEAHGNAAKN